jgi:hypothetical protein
MGGSERILVARVGAPLLPAALGVDDRHRFMAALAATL